MSAEIKKYNLAAGYGTPDYAVTLHGLNSLSTFSTGYYHKVNADTEAAAKVT